MHKFSQRHRASRKGGAITEMVITVPLLVLLVFASIEACNMIFVRQALTAAVYEGIRAAIRDDASNGSVISTCQQVVDGRTIKKAKIEVSVANVAKVAPGEPITVTVSATCDDNSISPVWFFGGRTIVATATMIKE